MKARMTARLGLANVVLALTLLGFAGAREASAQSSPGKPEAPLDIVEEMPKEADAGKFIVVTFRVTPRRDCTNLVTVVRGLDGVQLAQKTEKHHERCVAGKAVTQQATVRAKKGVAGFVVLDVSGRAGGSRFATSRSYEFSAKGAERKPQPIGEPGQDATGKPIMKMQAAPPVSPGK